LYVSGPALAILYVDLIAEAELHILI